MGSARGLPVRPPREERTKHETKPRETCVLERPRLCAFKVARLGFLGATPFKFEN